MFNQRLPDFQPVVAGNTATVKVPRYALTLNRVLLRLGGTTFTKAHITKIEVKIGSRPVWVCDAVGALAGGTILDMVNKYKGIFDQATNLTIDLTERDFMTIAAREVGGIDMSKLSDDIYINITIGAATAPTMYGTMFLTPPQGRDIEESQLIQKLVPVNYSYATGGRFTIPFEPKGALIKRMYATFTGTNGTATTEQNIAKIEVKKNGYILHELVSTDNKFTQQEYRKVPQSGMHVVDFCFDNNLSGAVVTADAASLEFALTLTAADSGVVLFEVLDAPYNL
ncbi:MAG: hypothetical protein J0H69_00615 [Burkholderiales bacterium]|nr:hypothetical protein [Burkholderiales bacterium]